MRLRLRLNDLTRRGTQTELEPLRCSSQLPTMNGACCVSDITGVAVEASDRPEICYIRMAQSAYMPHAQRPMAVLLLML